jgi:endonuclease-3
MRKNTSKLTAKDVISTLEKIYSPPRTFLHWKTPLDLLVATILSAQCTDDRVNIVTKTLFRNCRTPEDYLAVRRTALERDIHSCGTYRVKAKYVQELSEILLKDFHGKVPDTMEGLLILPGVGRKTAIIVLYAAFGKEEGIAVDTHVKRLALRLGLTRHRTPEKIELDLQKQTPRGKWGALNTLLISLGRAVCTARNRKCGACVFRDSCPSSLEAGRSDRAEDPREILEFRKPEEAEVASEISVDREPRESLPSIGRIRLLSFPVPRESTSCG